MNIVLLYSDVDYFILAGIAVIIAIFLFNWMVNKLKFRNKESADLSDDEIDLSHYALNFENTIVKSKPIGIGSKLILFTLALVIAIMPLYEFIETLRPAELFYDFSCLPNGF